MLRSAISAFTRVFDALWRSAADPGSIALLNGSRLCGAPPKRRCTASGTRVSPYAAALCRASSAWYSLNSSATALAMLGRARSRS